MSKKMVTIDGNTAAAHVAHATNEVIAICSHPVATEPLVQI